MYCDSESRIAQQHALSTGIRRGAPREVLSYAPHSPVRVSICAAKSMCLFSLLDIGTHDSSIDGFLIDTANQSVDCVFELHDRSECQLDPAVFLAYHVGMCVPKFPIGYATEDFAIEDS